jgi:hypothetical protein
MTCKNENPFDRFPPGFAAHRYRLTPEQIERNIRENEIQAERDERHRRKLIEEGKIRPDPELDGK